MFTTRKYVRFGNKNDTATSFGLRLTVMRTSGILFAENVRGVRLGALFGDDEDGEFRAERLPCRAVSTSQVLHEARPGERSSTSRCSIKQENFHVRVQFCPFPPFKLLHR